MHGDISREISEREEKTRNVSFAFLDLEKQPKNPVLPHFSNEHSQMDTCVVSVISECRFFFLLATVAVSLGTKLYTIATIFLKWRLLDYLRFLLVVRILCRMVVQRHRLVDDCASAHTQISTRLSDISWYVYTSSVTFYVVISK